jgi:predicted secreted protein
MNDERSIRVTLFFLCVICTAALWAVSAVSALGSRSEGGGSVIVLQKADSGREIQVRPGDVIQVELPGTGGTGYWWYVTQKDERYVELLSEETKSPVEKKPGGPVQGVWRFKTREPGRTELVMKYYRVWEGPDKAVDVFSVILTIK